MATREEIYLAALLHDIGKFWQRADTYWDKSENIKEETKNNVYNITRKNKDGYPTHQHVIWTYEFLRKKGSKLKILNDIVNLSAQHHYPDNEYQALIQLADWWASGMERDYDENEEALKLGKERFKKQPIGNIFAKVTVNELTAEEKTAFPLQALTIKEEKFFPVDFNEENANSELKYKNLWNEFKQEFDKLLAFSENKEDKNAIIQFSETLYFLLKKYCWSIPADTNESYPISSLFEHSKVTAAIAWCFKVFKDENPENSFEAYKKGGKLLLKEGQLPLLLLCVDLSGIQNFIYNIASAYAAKTLRGRSFFIQMLLNDVAREILHRTGAFQSNIIYSSGGKLFMLLPNTQKIKKTIDDFEKEILNKLWEKYKGEIYLCFGYVAFAYDKDIKDNTKPKIIIENESEKIKFSDLWRKAISKAAEKKNKRFIHKLLNKDDFEKLFKPSGEGGNKEICAVTGFESKDLIEIEENIKVDKEIKRQIEIGENLPGTEFIAFGDDQSFMKEEYINLITKHKLRLGTQNKIDFDNAEIYYVLKDNEPQILPKEDPKEFSYKKNIWGFTYYGGCSFPLNENKNIKTFEELAKTNDKDNVNKMGILRMDVDGLGLLFTNGFKRKDEKTGKIIDYSSFSNYATLSGMLDLFFNGYINTIREKEEFRDHVLIIYSGGDDLFAVGHWNKIIDFAYDVQASFKKFTGRNEITISAGIEILNPKFPISKAALMSGEAEEIAKNHKYNEQGKNSLCLFGIPINWDYEFESVKKWKEKFVEWLEKDIITKGLLMKLLSYYEQWIKSDKNDLSWKWNAAYNLARRRNSLNDEEKRKAIDEIKNCLFTEIYENRFRFDAFAVALRWAELECRK